MWRTDGLIRWCNFYFLYDLIDRFFNLFRVRIFLPFNTMLTILDWFLPWLLRGDNENFSVVLVIIGDWATRCWTIFVKISRTESNTTFAFFKFLSWMLYHGSFHRVYASIVTNRVVWLLVYRFLIRYPMHKVFLYLISFTLLVPTFLTIFVIVELSCAPSGDKRAWKLGH